ncbi:hypothetical protein SODALDRAFT_357715 [Sodiomyces alkalinus F11]|uniref:Uncharacterized protein n=1 Tax=Sodiomyces alkalinus (strain CBS 110278 / VKM F-3762 / F11) TaxID=1314773 RepID=A0A3N2Q4G0_SODAK|nr:hypothetical protein SODALDRAFT_357715 [Sodiomyces alkalinus F11]ROT41649.1 hypothetical protein SODALDRAFT_357715 [Sodiomyces alkalinus F11]
MSVKDQGSGIDTLSRTDLSPITIRVHTTQLDEAKCYRVTSTRGLHRKRQAWVDGATANGPPSSLRMLRTENNDLNNLIALAARCCSKGLRYHCDTLPDAVPQTKLSNASFKYVINLLRLLILAAGSRAAQGGVQSFRHYANKPGHVHQPHSFGTKRLLDNNHKRLISSTNMQHSLDSPWIDWRILTDRAYNFDFENRDLLFGADPMYSSYQQL